MVGIVLVTHGRLGSELLATAEAIAGPLDGACAVSLEPADSMDAIREKVEKAIGTVESGAGVLVLTDMFGGTPANIALSFLAERKVEVVTGCNLPMLLKLGTARAGPGPLPELARLIAGYGQKNIVFASELLESAKRTRAER